MDPDACLKRIKDAWDRKDAAELRQARQDLRAWIGRGGFPPSDPNWRDWMTKRRDR